MSERSPRPTDFVCRRMYIQATRHSNRKGQRRKIPAGKMRAVTSDGRFTTRSRFRERAGSSRGLRPILPARRKSNRKERRQRDNIAPSGRLGTPLPRSTPQRTEANRPVILKAPPPPPRMRRRRMTRLTRARFQLQKSSYVDEISKCVPSGKESALNVL